MPPLIRVDNREILDQLVAQKKRVQKSNPTMKKGGSLITRVQNICEQVQKRLGHYKDELGLITTKEDLHKYIDACIKNDIVSIDTETTGLDTFCDKIVGACLYTYGEKPVYVPINHVSYLTNIRCANQLTEADVAEEFQRLVDAQTKIIMFNAKFDIRVIRHQLGVYMTPAWCGFIAGKCLKENEPEGNLKFLWKKYCSPDKEAEHFTFDKMFDGLRFDLIPVDTAYLYAAKDALMTLELYDFQKPYLTPDDPKCIEGDLTRLAKLYREIELPIIPIVADIEDQGVVIDNTLSKKLSDEYTTKMQEAEKAFVEALKPYEQAIAAYKATHPDSKLENPVNMNSPVQLSELFYDVLKLPAVSKKDPKGTGKDILKALGHPLCEPILKYKNIAKLLSTYIDALPKLVNKKTGRLHCNFNQYGADTGRFSSSNPNFQNIPSREKSIRKLFMAARETYLVCDNGILHLLWGDIIKTLRGDIDSQDLRVGDSIYFETVPYKISQINIVDTDFYDICFENIPNTSTHVKRIHLLAGSDFSQQEPKLTADLSNDERFIKDCASGKDAYATIASIAFKEPYENCLEFYLDENGNKTHETNKDGKERRSKAKIILLGICYGKTMKSIAEDLKKTEQEAKEIYDAVMTNIGGLKHFMETTQEFARLHGYVETRWGRRRHIPDMMLQPYELTSINKNTFDPFFDSAQLGVIDETEELKQKFIQELLNAKWKTQKDGIKERIAQAGFRLKENTKRIEDATRQCVNSVVQGSASDQSKIAIRLVGTNEELKRLGFHMSILVHDEILGECPFITMKHAVPIFVQCMLNSAKDIRTGAKCDAEISEVWYGESLELEDLTHETLNKLKVKYYGYVIKK